MEPQSIFGRLFTFRQRPDRRPEEDFFTEAFAGVLCLDKRLARAVFEYLSGQIVASIVISTQQNYDLRRPDIVMIGKDASDGKHVIFLESKLESSEGLGQLLAYRQRLMHVEAKSRTLVYITKHADEDKDVPSDNQCTFVQKRWNDVYRRLTEYLSIQGHSDLVAELAAFMREGNMSFDLKPTELVAGTLFYNGRYKLGSILDDAWEKGRLRKAVASRGSGRWKYPDFARYQSPADSQSKVIVEYGFWFQTRISDDRNELGLVFTPSKEFPTAYVALYCDSGNPTEAYQEYRQFFDGLVKCRKWIVLGGASSGNPRDYIASKSYNLKDLTSDDLGADLMNFFAGEFDALSEAPFFRT